MSMSERERPAVEELDALHALLDKRTPVRAVVWQGQPGWAKRRASLRAHERILLAFAPLLRRWLAPGEAFTPPRYDPSLPIEAQRLRALAAIGRVVPQVLAAGRDAFVMADAGTTLPQLLEASPDADMRLGLLCEAARDLANWHRDGLWHGGAQLRNVIRTEDGRLGRIDFETSLDRHLPLSLLQAFDAALFFTSIVRTPDREALPQVAQSYVAAAPEAAVAALRRGLPLLRALAGSRVLQRLAPKEAERIKRVATLKLE